MVSEYPPRTCSLTGQCDWGALRSRFPGGSTRSSVRVLVNSYIIVSRVACVCCAVLPHTRIIPVICDECNGTIPLSSNHLPQIFGIVCARARAHHTRTYIYAYICVFAYVHAHTHGTVAKKGAVVGHPTWDITSCSI